MGIIKGILKFAFAGLLIAWLLKSGKLDFNLVKRALTESNLWMISFISIATTITLSAFRWRLLLQVKSKVHLGTKKIICLTWIGVFFNSFLPGAVTGDLIKLVYARDLDKDLSKSFLIMTALIDRIIGLVGLIFLLGIFTVINYSSMIHLSPQMKGILQFNLVLLLGATTFLILLFSPEKIQKMSLNLAKKIPVIGDKVFSLLDQTWTIGSNKKVMGKTVLLSMLLQFMNIAAFWIITSQFYGRSLPLDEVFTFIPIGLITIAIPISPAGLGVGHLVFEKLFSFAGVAGGASLFNVFFICNLSVNMLGSIPYILSGKRHSLEETQEFDNPQA